MHVSDPVALFLLTWEYKPCWFGLHMSVVLHHSPDHDKHALHVHVNDQLQLTFRASTSLLSIVERELGRVNARRADAKLATSLHVHKKEPLVLVHGACT